MRSVFGRLARLAFAGLVVGAIVLGIGGRLLMRLVAHATGGAPGFSVGGTLEVVAAGALFGVLGGLLLLPVPQRLGRLRAVALAAGLFGVLALTSDASRSALSTLPQASRIPAIASFAVLLVVFAAVLIRSCASVAPPVAESVAGPRQPGR